MFSSLSSKSKNTFGYAPTRPGTANKESKVRLLAIYRIFKNIFTNKQTRLYALSSFIYGSVFNENNNNIISQILTQLTAVCLPQFLF